MHIYWIIVDTQHWALLHPEEINNMGGSATVQHLSGWQAKLPQRCPNGEIVRGWNVGGWEPQDNLLLRPVTIDVSAFKTGIVKKVVEKVRAAGCKVQYIVQKSRNPSEREAKDDVELDDKVVYITISMRGIEG
jgi:hypothetical protein